MNEVGGFQLINTMSSSKVGTTGSAIPPKQKPIKKFSIKTEIQFATKRFKDSQKNQEWAFIPRSDLMSIIVKAITLKQLPFNGSKQLLPTYISMEEVVSHVRSFGAPEAFTEESVLTRKYKPVFYAVGIKNLQLQPMNGHISTSFPNYNFKQLMQGYEREEMRHKQLENHHPGTMGWSKNHSDFLESVHVEAVFDVFSSLLRTNSLSQSWTKLLDILSETSSPYYKLQPRWVLIALLHIRSRGVYCPNNFRDTAIWRFQKPEELLWYQNKYEMGQTDDFIISKYREETRYHQQSIQTEMQILRYPKTQHDHTKFSDSSVFFYSWRWGVWEQLPPVVQYRIISGCTQYVPPSTVFTVLEGVGERIGAGIKTSMEEMIVEQSSVLDEKIDKAATSMEVVGEKMMDGFFDRAKVLVSEFFSSANQYTDETVTKFSNKTKELLGHLPESVDELSTAVQSFKVMFETVVSSYLSSFKEFLPDGFKLDVDALLTALKYYILLINTENKFLRALLFFGILHAFGITGKIVGWVRTLISYLTVPEEDENVDPEGKQFTSASEMIKSIFGSVKNIFKLFVGYLASIFSGEILSKLQFSNLMSHTAGVMKNFHFIGGGILGITRIYDFAVKIISKVVSWVKEYIFKHTPEKKILAKKVIVWVLKVRYFASESGMNAIRMSANARKIAEGLFPEGQALLSQVSSTSPHYSRELLFDIQRYWSDVKTISNYVSRINAMSAFQPTMFHIQLVGAPGIGKSTMTKNLTQSLLRSLWGAENENSFYSYNPNLEYFDGYAGQRVMIVDDMFRYQEPKHLTTLIGLITNTPVVLPMANLEDKGCQLTSELMISSTNTPYPPSKDILCMEAIHRRRHMLINVVMDPRVKNAGTGSFDKALYDKYYPSSKYNKEDFPHLRFHLIRSVPRNTDVLENLSESPESQEVLKKYAAKLSEANRKIINIGFGKEVEIDPMFLYDNECPPPKPINLPCTEWTYREFLANCVLRFTQFRGMESTYTRKEKFSHVQTSFAEIDAIFTQENDLPDGCELEKVKLLENMFLEVSVPFGMDDPLGAKIYESEDSMLAPELDRADLNKIFEDKAAEQCGVAEPIPSTSTDPIFTSDDGRLTLEEENVRRQRLLARKNKHFKDTNALHILKQKKIVKQDRLDDLKYWVHGIEIDSTYTIWKDAPRSTFMGNSRVFRYKEFLDWVNLVCKDYMEEKAISHSMPSWMTIEDPNGKKELVEFMKDMERIVFSSNMVIPNDPLFPKDLHGKTVAIPIGFLSRIEFHDHRPYFMLTSSMPSLGEVTVTADDPYGNLKEHHIPYDGAFIWSTNASFKLWMLEFEQFTPSQQKKLVEDAAWRNKYTGFYTLKKLEEDVSFGPLKKTLKALQFFLNPVYEIFNAAPAQVVTVSMLLVFYAMVKLVISMTSLISPTITPTSKYLHRGPPSAIQHRPIFTSLFERSTFTQTIGSVMKRNVKQVTLSDVSGYVAHCQGLSSGQFLYINRHVLYKLDLTRPVLLTMNPGIDAVRWDYIIEPENIYWEKEGDLAIIYSKQIPMARDITSYFVPDAKYKELEVGNELVFLSRFNNEYGIEHNSYIGKSAKVEKITHAKGELESYNMILAEGTSTVGRSGSAVIYPKQVSGSFAILGIQAWMCEATTTIYVQTISRETALRLQEAITFKLNIIPIVREHDYEPQEIPPELTKAFTSPAYNNLVVATCKEESTGLVGKSQFRRTPIANLMDRDGFTSERVPAVLNPNDPNLAHGDKYHPLNNSLNKYFKDQVIAFRPQTLNYIKKNCVQFFKSKLDKEHFQKLSFDKSITGTREDGSNPMKLKSSPGIPFIFEERKEKGKKNWLRISEEGELEYVDESLHDRYLEFKSKMFKGILPLNCAYDFPKDELRPAEKAYGSVEKGLVPKTRSVTCMNMLYVILWRELTLDMWSSFHRAADGTFPLCPGINPEGPEWSNAYYYLSKFKNALDFDVSNWDGFFPPQVAFIISEIICEICEYPPNSPEELAIRSIITDLMFGYIQYGRVVYQKARGMISGFPGTAEINTMAHYILILYIYLELMKDHPEFYNFQSFNENVHCLIYGDDIILTFSDKIRDIFNGHSISGMYRSIGYPVTSADKSSMIPKYKELANCQFLKSTWNEIQPYIIVRKIDISVAYDMLYWVRAKEQPMSQFYDNLLDALRIVFGHGESVFNSFLQQLNKWLRGRKLPPILYSFDDLLQDHIHKYYV